MAKEFAKQFYNSGAWKKCRTAFIAIRQATDGGLCQTCRDELGTEAHHTIELTPYNIRDPAITLNTDLLKWNCHNCHTRERYKYERRVVFSFDEQGQPIPIPPHKLGCCRAVGDRQWTAKTHTGQNADPPPP